MPKKIATVVAIMLDKMNRTEANVAHMRSDMAALKSALDVAIERLSAPLATPESSDAR